jgi:hypothetical protein
MPQIVKKRRSGWAILAAGAMVASLLAVGASPAAAAPITASSEVNARSIRTACLGPALDAADFEDVAMGGTHSDSINCIAYYGITVGKNDGSFAPEENVSVFQMTEFVTRTAALVGADADAVFDGVTLSDPVTRVEMATLMFRMVDDIAEWVRVHPRSGAIQFDKDNDNVWQDADDYFDDARRTVPIAVSDMIGATYELGITFGKSGIVSTKGSVFDPFAPVTREQMASFITRTLAHSNLRPEGISAQRNNQRYAQVSLRSADFEPVDDVAVDLISSLYPAAAFDEDDGECVDRFTKDETPSFTKCGIDNGDYFTDDDGNVDDFQLDSDSYPVTAECISGGVYVFKTADTGAESRTFWAWSGQDEDDFDEDVSLVAKVEGVNLPLSAAPPNHAEITGGLGAGELAKFGETVNFTVQLETAADAPAPPDQSGNPYLLAIHKYRVIEDADGGGVDDDTDSAGEPPFGIQGYDFLEVDQTAETGYTVTDEARFALLNVPDDDLVWPNEGGSFNFRMSHRDTASAVDDPDVAIWFRLVPFPGDDDIDPNLVTDIRSVASNVTGNGGSGPATGFVIFSDDDSLPTSVTVSALPYQEIPKYRTNSATVKVTDQYGDPIDDADISVSSTLDAADFAEDADDDEVRYPEEVDITVQSNENGNDNDVDGEEGDDVSGSFETRRNGQARIGYRFTGNDPRREAITPSVLPVLGDNPSTADVETDFVLRIGIAADTANDMAVYWAEIGSEEDSEDLDNATADDSVLLLVPDVRERRIVVNEGTFQDTDETPDPTMDAEFVPMIYEYDPEDTFVVGGTGATLAMFEEALEAAATFPGSRITWESYQYDRPKDHAVWTVSLNCSPATT